MKKTVIFTLLSFIICLFTACDYDDPNLSLEQAAYKGKTKTVLRLIKEGSNVNKKEHEYPLIYASQNGHLKIVQALINAGANANVKDRNNVTPLILASQNGHLEIVQILIAAGADVNIKVTSDGSTALMRAAYWGHPKIAKTLITAGANINTKNNNGITALTLAKHRKHQKVVDIIEEALAKK